MHPLDLEELRANLGLGPCEAIECVARSRESGALELVTQLRPLAEAPTQTAEHEHRPLNVGEAIERAQRAHARRRERRRCG